MGKAKESSYIERRKKFPVGSCFITKRAEGVLTKVEILSALSRHSCGDWGDVCDDVWREDDEALRAGDRVQSTYQSISGTEFLVITVHDRSMTTILLPDEF